MRKHFFLMLKKGAYDNFIVTYIPCMMSEENVCDKLKMIQCWNLHSNIISLEASEKTRTTSNIGTLGVNVKFYRDFPVKYSCNKQRSTSEDIT